MTVGLCPAGIDVPPVEKGVELLPPEDKVFTKEELAKFDGIHNPSIYVSVKNVVFEVTPSSKLYTDEAHYKVFCGKDCSRALGLGTKDEKDLNVAYDDLQVEQLAKLNEWFRFFSSKYNIKGVLE